MIYSYTVSNGFKFYSTLLMNVANFMSVINEDFWFLLIISIDYRDTTNVVNISVNTISDINIVNSYARLSCDIV